MNTLETLKNALLISLVVILIYILYKRLISTLSKNRINAKYANIENSIRFDDGKGFIQVELKNKAYLIVEVYSHQGDRIEAIEEGDFEAGHHSFSFVSSKLEKGRYYYKVTSPYQESSQYFDIA